ncbi:PAP2 superfamily-domain-containing protein [Dichotomopilus funicola]|uniref:PAP2 superfamily-domain-containing protein n=1 Tax=Dichotomopilus funicola TaxID=1934379 RepID=A0AAN6ZN71_9PEZI|nr:PAP2 superfamily-domain-containing protein [Dichotomopilus funicola]
MPDDSVRPLIYARSFSPAPISDVDTGNHNKMENNMDLAGGSVRRKGKVSWVLALSYVFDWAVLVAFAAIGYVLGDITPNKRPFSLDNRDIAFPFTVKETVPVWLLVIVGIVVPIVIIIIICLVLVPGATVPVGTPKSLIWKRKLWELHTGLLGLALSLVAAWFITNGMKNLFGKPRPDLLSRCQPDLDNLSDYIIGGVKGLKTATTAGQLVSPNICKNPDKYQLEDGFRSYPSGHSSSAAAGLLYFSLFLASKFAITIPFLAPAGFADASAFTAFPSRTRLPSIKVSGPDSYELANRSNPNGNANVPSAAALDSILGNKGISRHNQTVSAVRRQAAAPPLYLLCIALVPFGASVFIAGSRWWDFRHHAFDILFGYLIGVVTAIFAFRYYHLPISSGAGWAWGPRSHDKAFWAGVGSFSYATDRVRGEYQAGDEEEALGDVYGRGSAVSGATEPITSSRKTTGASGLGGRGGNGSEEGRREVSHFNGSQI